MDLARDLLQRSLGEDRAEEAMQRLTAMAIQLPFQFLQRADPAQLRSFIHEEHPQVIALVLAHMSAEKASLVLSGLSPELQADVAHRIAVMGRANPETVRVVEAVLERRLSSVLQPSDSSRVGGLGPLVNIINRADRSTERQIVEGLESLDAGLAEEVRSRMFMFEDIVRLADRDVQQVLRQVDTAELALALKGVSDAGPRQDHRQPVRACRGERARGGRDARPRPPHPGRGGPAGGHPHHPLARGARRDRRPPGR